MNPFPLPECGNLFFHACIVVAASGNDWKRLEESKFRGIDVPDLKIDRK
jgi:hypothetical protein